MKPFNLELAKAGHSVCTRDGRKARIICFDRENHKDYNIVALVKTGLCENVIFYNNKGMSYAAQESQNDLVMVSVKKEAWINIYPNNGVGSLYYYETKEKAESAKRKDCIATIKIGWEE